MTRHRELAAFAAVLLLALAVRLRAFEFGIPGPFVPDEYEKAAVILQFRDGTFTHAAHQPSFLFNTFYLMSVLLEPLRGWILQRLDASSQPERLHEWMYHIWVGRLWMVLLSTATAGAVFALARRVAGAQAAVCAGILFALMPLSIAASHYIKEDTPLALWMTLTLLACVNVAEHGRWRDFLCAGLLCGFTFGSKYPGGLTLLAVVFAWVLHVRDRRAGADPSLRVVRMAVAVGMVLAGFALTSPAHVAQAVNVVRGVYVQSQYMQGGHHDGIRILPWGQFFTYYLRAALLPGMTAPVLAAGVAGLAMLWRRSRAGVVIGVWVLFYYLVAESMPAKPYPFFARYVLPLVPFLCVGAGACIVQLWEARSRWALAAAVVIVLAPLYATARFAGQMIPDTRERAAGWLNKHGDPSVPVIIVDGDTTLPYAPRLDAERWTVLPLNEQTLEDARKSSRPMFVVLNSFSMQRYFDHPHDVPAKTALYRGITESEELVKHWDRPHAQYGFHNPAVWIYRVGGADR